MIGILNIHKPSGITSRDAVNSVQRLIRPTKVGHAGTLDPLANGVLVLCLGAATRLVPYIQQMPKSYRGTFLLGSESDTEDIEGDVKEHRGTRQPTEEEIEGVLPQFLGQIMQRPPSYSALKISGRRAHALARAGHPVNLPPRSVQIHELQIASYCWPQLVIDIRCGSGTYVRSLGRDLADQLGTVAVMSALTRTAIGEFVLGDAILPRELTKENLSTFLSPARLALATLPTVRLTNDELQRIRHGLTIPNRFVDLLDAKDQDRHNQEIGALTPSGELAAILVPKGDNWGPKRNFAGSS